MVEAATGMRRTGRPEIQLLLGFALFTILALHAVLLLLPHPIVASRLATAAAPLLAAFCGLWRAQKVPLRERLPWRLLSASLLLWATGQAVEALIGQSSSALNLGVDASDFFNVIAALPMLLALSNTRRTESIHNVFYLDSAQTALAAILTYLLLYQTALTSKAAATAMATIYITETALLAVSAVLRLATWATVEERRRIYLVGKAVWIFLPINLGMNYASSHWNLRAGTIFDLLWSVPFVYAGWQALHLATTEPLKAQHQDPSTGRLLIEGICPLLLMASIFALAASVTAVHPVVGLSAIFLLLVIQSLHAGVVQLNYVTVQRLLLVRERELEEANIAMERLSMLDPLTGIANRRRLDAAFDEAWRRAIRLRTPVALLIIDVDFFKGINDLHGHTYGDECLVSVAGALLLQAGRPDDLLARFGGDEFALLLPDTDAQGAMKVAKQMHAAIHRLHVVNGASRFDGLLTVTIGIGVGDAELGTDPTALFEVADRALYQAKEMGRNRNCVQSLTEKVFDEQGLG